MTNNEIKKLVYKQKPNALLEMIRGGTLYYRSIITVGKFLQNQPIRFQIPISDIGTTDFFPSMEAKHLLRWLINEEN